MQDTKLIQIKVRENTLREIDEVTAKIHSPSMSDTIRHSVNIVYSLTKQVEEGDMIVIDGRDGIRRQLIITGMR